jgi:asparagine synthase (glutamine-hydrolysing)
MHSFEITGLLEGLLGTRWCAGYQGVSSLQLNSAAVCGIFGVVSRRGVSQDDPRLVRLAKALEHRGPDATSCLEFPGVAAGMHRLAINGLRRGDQPIESRDGRVSLMGNGEVYNSLQLRAAVESSGRPLASDSDLAPVAELWAEYGPACLPQVDGMFALAVLDRRSRTVTLARDRMGEKPLYFVRLGEEVWWSSELLPLVRAGIVTVDLDASSLQRYLIEGLCAEPKTPILGIEALEAGSVLRIDVPTLELRGSKYWRPEEFVGEELLDADVMAHLLENAVSKALMSDVPIGVALSAGLDSTYVAATARRHREDISTFTVDFDSNNSANEGSLAASTSHSIGVAHTLIRVDTRDVADSFLEVCVGRDLPVADVTGPAYDALCRVVRNAGLKVLLTGQGADELFWGYRWTTRWMTRVSRLSKRRQSNLRSWSDLELPLGASEWLESFQEGFGFQSRRMAAALLVDPELSSNPLRLQPKWFRDFADIKSLVGGGSHSKADTAGGSRAAGVIAADFMIGMMRTYLRSNGLAQMDRLSMQHGLEARTPFVDRTLVEYVLSGAGRDIDSGNTLSKDFFRSVVARQIPPEVLARPKSGFRPPVRDWLDAIWRGTKEWRREPLSPELLGWDKGSATRLLESPTHLTGEVNHVGLRLLTLEVWLREVL